MFVEQPRLFETCLHLFETASGCVLGWSRNPPAPGGVHLILKLSHFSSLMASSHFTNRRKKDKTKRYFSIMPKKYFCQELPTPFWYNFYSLRKWDKSIHRNFKINYIFNMYVVSMYTSLDNFVFWWNKWDNGCQHWRKLKIFFVYFPSLHFDMDQGCVIRTASFP